MTYSSNSNNSVSLADYISMNHDNIPLGHFLKFSPDSNKRDSMESSGNQDDGNSEMVVYEDTNSGVIMNFIFLSLLSIDLAVIKLQHLKVLISVLNIIYVLLAV